MVITCPSCSERYRLSADKVKGRGAKITCPGCSHLFVVFADEPGEENGQARSAATGMAGADITTGAFRAVGLDEGDSPATTTGSIRVVAPGPRGKKRSEVTTVATSANGLPTLATAEAEALEEELPDASSPAVAEEQELKASELDFREVGIVTWKVKVSIGLVYDFSDIMTLKKYLDDQKVTPDDLISHNAKSWTRIGDIDNLDDHFVSTWKAARDALKTGPGAKKKPKANATESAKASESEAAIAAASREVAGGQPNLGPAMEDPFAKAREQRRAGGGRRKPKVEEKSSGGAIKAAAAVLVLGGLLGGAWLLNDAKVPEPTQSTDGGELVTIDPETGEDLNVVKDDIRQKIRDEIQRSREELQAGMENEPQAGLEDGEPDPQAAALKKARLEPVRPSEQSKRVARVDSQGFRKPLVAPVANRGAAVPANTPAKKGQGSVRVTEQQTRDPGRIYYDNGRKAMERKNYGSALKMFQASVDKSPKCGVCWEGLGAAYQALEEAQKAAKAFEKAEELGVPVNAKRP